MRRFLTAVASVFVILAVLAPHADAQQPAAGPTPKVTINGLIDNVTSYSKNMSLIDLDVSRNDKEWVARVRARPDITAELGTTKFVLGLEIDLNWGSSCVNDSSNIRCNSETLTASEAAFGNHVGTTAGVELNSDVIPAIEVKWAYTEFALPGAPTGSIMRLGVQPFTVTHKLATLATGDFAGLYTSIALTPSVKLNFTYAQIEAANTGAGDGFFRGNDFAIFASADVSPFKGLDLRPIFSWAQILGNTSTFVRQAKGGLAASSIQGTVFPTNGVVGPLDPGGTACTVNGVATQQCVNNQLQAGAGAALPAANPAAAGTAAGFSGASPNINNIPGLGTAVENRYTIGLDAKLTVGPFYLDPTVFYQWGQRQFVVPEFAAAMNPATCASPAGCTFQNVATGFARAGQLATQDMSAWLVDIRGGWRAGPLLVEAAAVYSTGNKATQDIRNNRQELRYFQPIDTDSTYFGGGWGEIIAPNIDYFNTLFGAPAARGLNPAVGIGYDKYGLKRFGARASYALTPALTLRTVVTSTWTAEGVDTRGNKTGANGIIPSNIGRAAFSGSNYYGTEIDAGLTWRFAPGLDFDLVAGHMFTGDALKAAISTETAAVTNLNINGTSISVNRPDRNPKDIETVAARVRFSF